jgi:hypothetical protein
MSRKRREGHAFKQSQRTDRSAAETLKQGDKNWEVACSACGELPTVHPTGLCGPCCFGEAETAGGNW